VGDGVGVLDTDAPVEREDVGVSEMVGVGVGVGVVVDEKLMVGVRVGVRDGDRLLDDDLEAADTGSQINSNTSKKATRAEARRMAVTRYKGATLVAVECNCW
jgi:hypothetical protein